MLIATFFGELRASFIYITQIFCTFSPLPTFFSDHAEHYTFDFIINNPTLINKAFFSHISFKEELLFNSFSIVVIRPFLSLFLIQGYFQKRHLELDLEIYFLQFYLLQKSFLLLKEFFVLSFLYFKILLISSKNPLLAQDFTFKNVTLNSIGRAHNSSLGKFI